MAAFANQVSYDVALRKTGLTRTAEDIQVAGAQDDRERPSGL